MRADLTASFGRRLQVLAAASRARGGALPPAFPGFDTFCIVISACRGRAARGGTRAETESIGRTRTWRVEERRRGRRAGPPPGAAVAGAEASGPTGRPRSEEAHKAILDATLALLAEVGFSGLTVEGVAQRAGVGKATIYRRWPSKLPLVVEAYGQLPGMEDVDTGDLAEDLKQMLQSYLQAFNTTALSAVLPSLAGERAHNAELSKVFDPVSKERRVPLIRALGRAVARGEIAPDVDLELAADLVVGPIAVCLFFKGGRLHPKMVAPMVDLALEGIRGRSPRARCDGA